MKCVFSVQISRKCIFKSGVQTLTPLYHAASNPVERKNEEPNLIQLGILVGDRHTGWNEHLAAIRFAINTTINTGRTPSYPTFARELRSPDDGTKDLRAIVENENFVPKIYWKYWKKRANEFTNNKSYADERRRSTPKFKATRC